MTLTPIHKSFRRFARSIAAAALACCCALHLSPTTAAAAPAALLQATEVDVSLTSGLAKVGEPLGIRITVTQGGRGGGDAVKVGVLPKVDGLEFGRAKSAGTKSYTEFDNRRRMVSLFTSSYLIEVRPSGPGEYLIPPISVTVGDEVYVRPVQSMELRVVEDLAASDLLFMERREVPKRVYEGEPYTVEFDFGWDANLQADSLSLRIPWYGRQDGVVELEIPTSGQMFDFPVSGNQRIPVAGLSDTKRDGRKFRAFRLRRRYVATRSGTVEFSRSIFEFTPQSERGGRFFRGRGRTYYRPLDPFSIEVVPIPEAGRPIEWTGAVGQISASREALRRDVDAGEPIDFTVTYSGIGNLEFFPAPDLSRMPAFDGFRVLGVNDEKGAYERIIKYDLVPLSASATEIPSVPLSVFDTTSDDYVTVTTDPLEVRVRKVAGADGPDPFGEEIEEEKPLAIVLRDIEARPVGAQGGASAGGLFQRGPGAGGALAVLLLAFAAWRILKRVVRSHGDPASAEARRRRGALRSLERELRASDPKELSVAFETFMAARTGTEPAEWIGQAALPDDLGQLPPQLNQDYAKLRDDLDAAIFSGRSVKALDVDRIRSFARAVVAEGL